MGQHGVIVRFKGYYPVILPHPDKLKYFCTNIRVYLLNLDDMNRIDRVSAILQFNCNRGGWLKQWTLQNGLISAYVPFTAT